MIEREEIPDPLPLLEHLQAPAEISGKLLCSLWSWEGAKCWHGDLSSVCRERLPAGWMRNRSQTMDLFLSSGCRRD